MVTGQDYLIRVGSFNAQSAGPGTLSVTPTCAAIPSLAANFDCHTNTVQLSWAETTGYVSLALTANGLPVLPEPIPTGGANSAIDTSPPGGFVTYELTATCPNGRATPSGSDFR